MVADQLSMTPTSLDPPVGLSASAELHYDDDLCCSSKTPHDHFTELLGVLVGDLVTLAS
jgi:hypothetical protein